MPWHSLEPRAYQRCGGPAPIIFNPPALRPVVQVRITAPVKGTEDPQKVRTAIVTLFPDAVITDTDGGVAATSQDLQPLRRRIFELRIIDTFRGQFLHGMDDAKRTTTFRLSKQAALANHVSFTPREHALGDLTVTVTLEETDKWTDIERLGFWLCPETKDGEIVGAVEP